MKAIALLSKVVGSLLLAFAGYFIAAAEGWPGKLDAMTLERNLIGGAFGLLGLLCLIATFTPKPRAKPAASRPVFDDIEPAVATAPAPAPPEPAPEPEAIPAPVAEPFQLEPEPEPETVVALEPEPEPVPEPEPEPESPTEPFALAPPESEPAPQLALEPAEPSPPAAHPASLAAVRSLLASGDALFGEGRIDEALEPYSEALDMARGLDRAAPSEETRELLACALKAVADAHDECGRLDPATLAYEEALSIRRAQLQADPTEPKRKRALSLILERLGDVRDARGHNSRALDLYRTSLPIAESLAAEEPDNAVYREDLAQTRRRITELEAQMGPVG